MAKNSIFRDELPGEKKSIINLLMTGYIVVISCLGYAAFFLYVQLGQVERIVGTMNTETLEPKQLDSPVQVPTPTTTFSTPETRRMISSHKTRLDILSHKNSRFVDRVTMMRRTGCRA